jgi:hypothetical protein
MNSCVAGWTEQATETKIWEREGQTWPDTSQLPDSQTSTPRELVGLYGGTCPEVSLAGGPGPFNPEIDPKFYCPEGMMFVRLPDVVHEEISSTSTWKQWVSVEPEIPHLKTYHIEQTKTTIYVTKWVFSWVCLNPATVQELGDNLRDLFPPPPKPQAPAREV